MNIVKCEFCGGRFTEANPNMGTHRDFHGSCQVEAQNEGHDIGPNEDNDEPYQVGMEIDRDDPFEFSETPAGQAARDFWAREYDELDGAPEGDWDR